MTLSKFTLAAAALALSASSAFATEYTLTSSATVAADSATVWSAIGDFVTSMIGTQASSAAYWKRGMVWFTAS